MAIRDHRGNTPPMVFGQATKGALRCTLLSPVSRQTVAHDAPPLRGASILRASTITFGQPSRLPFARGFRRPAFTRSTNSERSNSATAPRTVNTILPAGVLVSICSGKRNKLDALRFERFQRAQVLLLLFVIHAFVAVVVIFISLRGRGVLVR